MKKLFAIVCAVLLIGAFTAPAMAKTYVGGIVFTDFYYYDTDAEYAMGGRNTTINQQATENDYSETIIEVPNITRLRARWTNEDNVGMYIELQTATAGVALRHAYGWWDVNPSFRILAGHTTTPFSPLIAGTLVGFSAQGPRGAMHCIGIGYGEFYSGRFPQVRFQFKYPNNMGRLAIALVDPSQGNLNLFAPTTPPNAAVVNNVAQTVREETTIPRIDIGSPLYFGALKLYPSVFWQTFDIDQAAPGVDDDYDAWGLSLGIKYGFQNFTFSGEINYGENWGDTAGVNSLPGNPIFRANTVQYVDENGDGVFEKAEDTECLAWFAQVGFKMGKATPTLIVGNHSIENDGTARLGSRDDIDIEVWMYGISVPIDLAKGFRIRPELMIYDNDDSALAATDANGDGAGDNFDFGKEFILGVQFQIAF